MINVQEEKKIDRNTFKYQINGWAAESSKSLLFTYKYMDEYEDENYMQL